MWWVRSGRRGAVVHLLLSRKLFAVVQAVVQRVVQRATVARMIRIAGHRHRVLAAHRGRSKRRHLRLALRKVSRWLTVVRWHLGGRLLIVVQIVAAWRGWLLLLLLRCGWWQLRRRLLLWWRRLFWHRTGQIVVRLTDRRRALFALLGRRRRNRLTVRLLGRLISATQIRTVRRDRCGRLRVGAL